jgi:hypothetical protein
MPVLLLRSAVRLRTPWRTLVAEIDAAGMPPTPPADG